MNFAHIKELMPLSLKNRLVPLLRARSLPLPPGRRCFIFLAADYGNIGDLAITAAQARFLTAAVPHCAVVPVPISSTRELLGSIRQQARPDDLVTVVGGGNMGSLYPDIEALRQLVIRAFPHNRVICFPQTLDWGATLTSRRALQRIVSVYSAHPDLHLFARETVSHAKLRDLFAGCPSVKIGLSPDIVLSASADALGARPSADRQCALLCLREDRERHVDEQLRRELAGALVNVGLCAHLTDTHAGGMALAPELCAQLLASKLTEFGGARLVVTDRLHGMILAALVGTPCLALPNTNHKVAQTWRDWLANVPHVRFLSYGNATDVAVTIRELASQPGSNSSLPVIDPSHFAMLRAAIDTP